MSIGFEKRIVLLGVTVLIFPFDNDVLLAKLLISLLNSKEGDGDFFFDFDNGFTIHNYNDGDLIACFDEGVSDVCSSSLNRIVLYAECDLTSVFLLTLMLFGDWEGEMRSHFRFGLIE